MRSTRRLHVTDAGKRWYEHSVRVLREVEEARASVQSSTAVRGTLDVAIRVGPIALRDRAVEGAGLAYLPDFLVEDVAAGRVKRVLPEWTSPPWQAVAIHRAELRGAARLRAFLDAVTA